jgi:hypothetical protein
MQLDLLDHRWMDMHCSIIILYHTDTVLMKCPSTSKLKIIHLQCLAHYHNPVNVDEFEDAYGVNSIAGS